jgi:hypothetical protein
VASIGRIKPAEPDTEVAGRSALSAVSARDATVLKRRSPRHRTNWPDRALSDNGAPGGGVVHNPGGDRRSHRHPAMSRSRRSNRSSGLFELEGESDVPSRTPLPKAGRGVDVIDDVAEADGGHVEASCFVMLPQRCGWHRCAGAGDTVGLERDSGVVLPGNRAGAREECKS